MDCAAAVTSSSAASSPLCFVHWQNGPNQRQARKRGRPLKVLRYRRLEAFELDETVETPFQFVDCRRPITDSRRIIKKHVMKDHLRKRRQNDDNQLSSELALHKCLPRSVDPFDAFPVRLETYMMELIHSYIAVGSQAYYALEKYTTYDPIKSFWLPLAFRHAAFLHALVACSAILTSGILNNTAVYHLNAAISSIREDLSTGSHLLTSDANITVVCTIAMLEEGAGRHGNWKIHMSGLQELVRMRGGLNAFKTCPLVLNKIQHADLSGCIETGETPYFITESWRLWKQNPPIGHSYYRLPLRYFNAKLESIFTRLAQEVQLLNDLFAGEEALDLPTIRTSLCSLQYELLYIDCDSLAVDLVRTGLLQFLATILDMKGTGANTLENKIRSLVERIEAAGMEIPSNCEVPLEYQLWIMIIAGSTVTGDRNLRAWYLSTISSLALSIGILGEDSTEMKSLLIRHGLFWAQMIHEGALQSTWNEATAINGNNIE